MAQQGQHQQPINWVQPSFQGILRVGFCLVIFKGTEQVESNTKDTSLILTASRNRNLNWIPQGKEHTQHHRAGALPSHGFPFIFGFTPFTPRKRGSLLKQATESARLAVYIIDLLYIIDFSYCHRAVPTSTKAFLAFANIQEALLVLLNQIHEISNPSNFSLKIALREARETAFDVSWITEVLPSKEREKATPNGALLRTRVVELHGSARRAVDLPALICCLDVKAVKRSQQHPGCSPPFAPQAAASIATRWCNSPCVNTGRETLLRQL